MKSLLRIAIVFTLLAGGVARGQDQIPWAADFRQACEQAAQQRRLVLIHFYADDCPPCVRVEQNVFSRPEVAAAIARSYVPVKVHAMQNRELAQRYQVTRWPTDIAVTPAGLEIHRSTSPQVPEHYVELVNLMALKAGVGTDRQWAANMEQVGQATLAPTANIAQAAAQGQQQWSQQAQDAAQQFGQQTQNAVQQYQTQVQDSAQQFQGQAASTAQQFQEQTLAAGQQAQTAVQQFGDAARASAAPWQTAANQQPPASNGALPPYMGVANPFFGQQPPQQPPPATSAWQPPQQQQQPQPQPAPQQQQQFVPAPQPAPAAAPQFVAASEAPPVCMDGFCPVTLLEAKKWQKADPQYGAIHRGRTYLFASAEQQKKFLANPDAFAPVLSGYDPVRFATTGQLVDGNRAFGVITHGDNRIFLFADKAALEQFERSPRSFSEPAYQAMQRGDTVPTYR